MFSSKVVITYKRKRPSFRNRLSYENGCPSSSSDLVKSNTIVTPTKHGELIEDVKSESENTDSQICCECVAWGSRGDLLHCDSCLRPHHLQCLTSAKRICLAKRLCNGCIRQQDSSTSLPVRNENRLTEMKHNEESDIKNKTPHSSSFLMGTSGKHSSCMDSSGPLTTEDMSFKESSGHIQGGSCLYGIPGSAYPEGGLSESKSFSSAETNTFFKDKFDSCCGEPLAETKTIPLITFTRRSKRENGRDATNIKRKLEVGDVNCSLENKRYASVITSPCEVAFDKDCSGELSTDMRRTVENDARHSLAQNQEKIKSEDDLPGIHAGFTPAEEIVSQEEGQKPQDGENIEPKHNSLSSSLHASDDDDAVAVKEECPRNCSIISDNLTSFEKDNERVSSSSSICEASVEGKSQIVASGISHKMMITEGGSLGCSGVSVRTPDRRHYVVDCNVAAASEEGFRESLDSTTTITSTRRSNATVSLQLSPKCKLFPLLEKKKKEIGEHTTSTCHALFNREKITKQEVTDSEERCTSQKLVSGRRSSALFLGLSLLPPMPVEPSSSSIRSIKEEEFIQDDATLYHHQSSFDAPSPLLSRHKVMLDNIVSRGAKAAVRGGGNVNSFLDNKFDLTGISTISNLWSEEELDYLWIGVRRYGRGNWDAMLRDNTRLRFSSWRTSADLAQQWEHEQSKLFSWTTPNNNNNAASFSERNNCFLHFRKGGMRRRSCRGDQAVVDGTLQLFLGDEPKRPEFGIAGVQKSTSGNLKKLDPISKYDMLQLESDVMLGLESSSSSYGGPRTTTNTATPSAAKRSNLPHWLREVVSPYQSSGEAVALVAHQPHSYSNLGLRSSSSSKIINNVSGETEPRDRCCYVHKPTDDQSIIINSSDASSEETISDDNLIYRSS